MFAFILLLVLVYVAVGIIGAVVKGLLWLTVIAAILFLATVFFGGRHAGRSRERRRSA